MASAVIVDADMVAALRDAVRECGDRGLINASKWASELLLGVPDKKRRAPPPANEAIAAPITQPRHPNAPPLQALPEHVRIQEKEWEEEDRDYITTARALFDGKDFVRAVHWLRTCKSAKAHFLSVYSQYMASEKQALRDWYKLDMAHGFTVIDKDRPEICCLIGNYFSLRNEHEKAIKYFKRATQLDRTYLSAWTLMGHEYVEMKNSHAAIEAYRKAVGHMMSASGKHRAFAMKKWDGEELNIRMPLTPREAIECFKRALIGADPCKLPPAGGGCVPSRKYVQFPAARLYAILAPSLNCRLLTVCTSVRAHTDSILFLTAAESDKPVAEYAKSSVYVARYHIIHGGGDLALAKELLEPIASSNAEEVSQATDLLKKARSAQAKIQMDAAQAQSQAQA
ncbi:hypothetical protein EVJ58_g6367 [Rhodofomes roseus]|uniref:Cdc23 domain-containing protein n=1 Tax=Rhodofomes roseus TaxID=34475 RepID=A0A4Y9Y846_9APHY|nr:hypothetical protein EVJ58_g6367 [Rhodofomes roseus]